MSQNKGSWQVNFSHGEIRRTSGPTGQKLIRSDKSHLFSGPKDRQWSANVFIDTTAQAELIHEPEVNTTHLTEASIKEPAKGVRVQTT